MQTHSDESTTVSPDALSPVCFDALTLDTLDWPILESWLKAACTTANGQRAMAVDRLFCADDQTLVQAQAQVEETKTLLVRYGAPFNQSAGDMEALLKRLAKGGELGSAKDGGLLLDGLVQARQLARFFVQHRSRSQTPALWPLVEHLSLPNEAIDSLQAVFTVEGQFQDHASDTWANLNQTRSTVRQTLRDSMNGWMRRPPQQMYLQDLLITERDGRQVVPVKVEHRSDVPGAVLDTSGSGATLFVEPKVFAEQNNRLVALEADLRAEAKRLLKVASQALEPLAADLLAFHDTVGQLDVLLAKAQLSRQLRANPVVLAEADGTMDLRQARHPVLMLQHDKTIDAEAAVVPNDIVMLPPQRAMIITGPNTGGKTVTLKLVGLCSVMMQLGLHLPVQEGSRMSRFQPVLCDMGDSQDLVQNLSTFSGHIRRLGSFCQRPDLQGALVLIDEICAGTDPGQGALLAQSLLHYFTQRGASVLVTTHLGHLKLVAYQLEHYVNASVEFDTQSLQPTYRLSLGVSGTSHALDIAERLGLDPSIITYARQLEPTAASTPMQLVSELEEKQVAVGRQLRESERLASEMQQKEQTVQSELDKLEKKKKKALELFKKSLQDKLQSVEMELNDLKKQLRDPSSHADPAGLSAMGRRLAQARQTFSETMADEQAQLYPHKTFTLDELAVGDEVESRDLQITGCITELNPKKGQLTIQAGMITSTIGIEDVVNHRKADERKWRARQFSRQSRSSGSAASVTVGVYKQEIDLRGMTRDEALQALALAYDGALRESVAQFHIIHGKGTGVLQKAVWDFLKHQPAVVSFAFAEATDGGAGKTIARFIEERA
ncbi:MAG: Smr/MutS family protein [Cyanobacteria bacterium HKST-UBA03]|nr:Smr/MutS family protein [Cyanobacteria bacterium HKST-UBA03]